MTTTNTDKKAEEMMTTATSITTELTNFHGTKKTPLRGRRLPLPLRPTPTPTGKTLLPTGGEGRRRLLPLPAGIDKDKFVLKLDIDFSTLSYVSHTGNNFFESTSSTSSSGGSGGSIVVNTNNSNSNNNKKKKDETTNTMMVKKGKNLDGRSSSSSSSDVVLGSGGSLGGSGNGKGDGIYGYPRPLQQFQFFQQQQHLHRHQQHRRIPLKQVVIVIPQPIHHHHREDDDDYKKKDSSPRRSISTAIDGREDHDHDYEHAADAATSKYTSKSNGGKTTAKTISPVPPSFPPPSSTKPSSFSLERHHQTSDGEEEEEKKKKASLFEDFSSRVNNLDPLSLFGGSSNINININEDDDEDNHHLNHGEASSPTASPSTMIKSDPSSKKKNAEEITFHGFLTQNPEHDFLTQTTKEDDWSSMIKIATKVGTSSSTHATSGTTSFSKTSSFYSSSSSSSITNQGSFFVSYEQLLEELAKRIVSGDKMIQDYLMMITQGQQDKTKNYKTSGGEILLDDNETTTSTTTDGHGNGQHHVVHNRHHYAVQQQQQQQQKEVVESFLKFHSISINYLDIDGDICMISTTEEFVEALEQYSPLSSSLELAEAEKGTSSGRHTMKMQVIVTPSSPASNKPIKKMMKRTDDAAYWADDDSNDDDDDDDSSSTDEPKPWQKKKINIMSKLNRTKLESKSSKSTNKAKLNSTSTKRSPKPFSTIKKKKKKKKTNVLATADDIPIPKNPTKTVLRAAGKRKIIPTNTYSYQQSLDIITGTTHITGSGSGFESLPSTTKKKKKKTTTVGSVVERIKKKQKKSTSCKTIKCKSKKNTKNKTTMIDLDSDSEDDEDEDGIDEFLLNERWGPRTSREHVNETFWYEGDDYDDGCDYRQDKYDRLVYLCENNDTPTIIAKLYKDVVPVDKIIFDNNVEDHLKDLNPTSKLRAGTPIVLPLMWNSKPVEEISSPVDEKNGDESEGY